MGLLIYVLIAILVVGVIVWAINNFLPMDPKFKQLFNAVVIIVVLIWLILRLLPLAHLP